MFISNEDYNYLEKLCDNLDNVKFHDFHDLLRETNQKKSGTDAFVIYVRDEKEISEKGVDPKMIITRDMIDAAYRAIKGSE